MHTHLYIIIEISFQGGPVSDELQKLQLPIISRSQCLEAYPNRIEDGMFCAGYLEGGRDSCKVRK